MTTTNTNTRTTSGNRHNSTSSSSDNTLNDPNPADVAAATAAAPPDAAADKEMGLPVNSYRFEKLAQKKPGPMEHPSITFGPPVIVFFDLIVPIIAYYAWYNTNKKNFRRDCTPYWDQGVACPRGDHPPQYDKDIMGYAIISFGIGELWILLARTYRLWFYRDECAPLLSRARWVLDATSWVYGVAMICALVPFVVSSALVIPKLYLYSPACLMAFLGILMVVTLIPFPIPIGINSHVRGTAMRPFIYYAAEDFIAVDGLQDREFRVRYNARYENSKEFRQLFVWLTLWWIAGVAIYIGCVSAVIWKLEFHSAFGTSLGLLFSYIIIWAGVSYLYVMWELGRQRKQAKKDGILAPTPATAI